MTSEQLREAQKDSVINASFKGLSLGESKETIMKLLTEMENTGEIRKSYTGEYSTNVEDCLIENCLYAVNAAIIPEMTYFKTNLAIKEGDNYKQKEAHCYLGFLQDSLSIIIIETSLDRDNFLEAYTQKYGGLYYIEDAPKSGPWGREYIGGTRFNQIYETTAITANNLAWKFKNAEIYLCDMTEFETVYTYDADDFRREWAKADRRYDYYGGSKLIAAE